jgi:hypothetical protein
MKTILQKFDLGEMLKSAKPIQIKSLDFHPLSLTANKTTSKNPDYQITSNNTTQQPIAFSFKDDDLKRLTEKSQIQRLRQQLKDNSVALIDFDVNVISELNELINNCPLDDYQQKSKSYAIKLGKNHPIVENLKMIGERLLGGNCNLNHSDSRFVVNPQTTSWHTDREGSNNLIFCLTLKREGTQYITKKNEENYRAKMTQTVIGNSKGIGKLSEDVENDHIKTIPDHQMAIFLGQKPSHADALSEKQWLNDVSALIHRSPTLDESSEERRILLIRFTILPSDNT